MRQQVRIVYENDDELEINFNCDEDPRSRNRLTFRLHPPSSATQTESPRDKSRNADKLSEIRTPDSGGPVEFVIKVRKYKGYLIVQHGERVFSVYGQSGEKCGETDTLKGACSIVDRLTARSSFDDDESTEKREGRLRP